MTKQHSIANKLILFASIWMLFIKCFTLPPVIINGSSAFTGIICFLYYLFHGNKKQLRHVLLLDVFLSLCMVISMQYNNNASFDNVLWIWAYSGVAILIVENGVSKLTGLIVFWVSIVIIFGYALSGGNPQNFYKVGSANIISALLLFAYFIYYASHIYNTKESNLSVLPLFLYVFVSIWSSNRSGLMVAGFLLLCIFLLNFTGNMQKKILGSISIATISILVYFFWDSIYANIGAGFAAKAERYGIESIRTEIWSEYINAAFSSFYDFLLGVDHGNAHRTPLLSNWEGNTHNCFLMLHSKYGILGFVVMVYLILKKMLFSIKVKSYYDLVIVIAVIIRGFFDWVAFPGIHDIVFFWFIFNTTSFKTNRHRGMIYRH